jgi:hypothetical protein
MVTTNYYILKVADREHDTLILNRERERKKQFSMRFSALWIHDHNTKN